MSNKYFYRESDDFPDVSICDQCDMIIPDDECCEEDELCAKCRKSEIREEE